MTKAFTLFQLFSIIDGRLASTMDDVYITMNHICDDNLYTHQLPVAKKYLIEKNPMWAEEVSHDLTNLKVLHGNVFENLIEAVKESGKKYNIPQLKDEFDTSDYVDFMVENSLLNR